ncbi:MAG TPA: universal stress protein [Baekduia sp.]|nr:universal stress protein [Baekduia sp.]
MASPDGIERVVVGYDASDGANAAAAFGLWLTAKAGVRTTIVHASPTPESAPSAGALPAAAMDVVADEAAWQRRLDALREYAPDPGPIETRVVRGGPAGALIATALEARADVILVGSHGTGAIREAFLGSVSAQLLSHAPCSAMVFREGALGVPATRARAVVVGVDGSPGARLALHVAQGLAVPLGAALVLVHAHDLHVPFVSQPPAALRDELRADAEDVLRRARATIAAPIDSVVEEIHDGRAREALVSACEQHAPALLVVGCRGRGGFEGLMLGSTSRWVAGHAPCPVVVARPRRG